jgi:hypothetical protein
MVAGWAHSQGAGPSEQISQTEAEILIYLLPEAQQVRADGMDIGWHLETSPALNQRDFYTFMVFDATRRNAGSVTIGFFAVNKWSAEVWDVDLGRLVSSTELRGIQTILRRAHHVDAQTVERYRNVKPE